jgi:sigma-B regulation protein RsbU (phosphoserine phosphatase)
MGKVWTYTHMGDMWSLLFLSEEPAAEFDEVSLEDFPEPPYPQPGDTLIEVNGLPATVENYFSVFNPGTEPGIEVPIAFSSDGEVLETTIVTRSVPFINAFQILVLTALKALITLALLFISIYGTARRRDSIPVRYLALFCLTLAAQVSSGAAYAPAYQAFGIPAFVLWALLFLLFAQSSAWLGLTLHFPREHPVVRNRRAWIGALLIAIPLALFLWNILGYENFDSPLNGPVLIVFNIVGLLALVRSFRRAESFLEERQTRLLLIGATPAMLFQIVLTSILIVSPGWFGSFTFITRMYILIFSYLIYLMVPLFFGLAIRRYRLLELEAKLKRGTRFFLTNLFLLGVMLGAVYLIAHFILDSLGVESRTPTLVIGLVMALGFVPGQRKLRSLLEERFYPEKSRLREILRDFLRTSLATADAGTFWQGFEARLADGLGTERIYPVICHSGDPRMLLEGLESLPFCSDDELVRRLADSRHPLLVDELLASGKVDLTGDQREWLETTASAILLPLHVSSGLAGFLALGKKSSEEDYSSEELELLQSLSAQVSLVAENLELLSEKIEKEKLDQQLEVARSIQERLLPDHSPETPGLEVEGLIRICLQVAGDYYDILPLEDGRTAVAIGDVSGKGVGPALLMANLQASLRTTQEIGIELSDSVSRINRLVCENTPTDMFITFFVSVFEPETGTLRYVNAGHDPPMLIGPRGSSTRLTEGGLLLGFDRESVYREGSVHLGPGETLLMYTDGVTEAMDELGEEFGEERLLSVAVDNSDQALREILSAVEAAVVGFHGTDHFYDDFTLIAMRTKGSS